MKTLAALAAALAAGCAVAPPTDEQLPWTPQGRYLDPHYLRPAPHTGSVVVANGAHVICDLRLFVDGRGAVNFDDYEKVLLFLPEGDHTLAVQPRGYCLDILNDARVAVADIHVTPGAPVQRFHIHMTKRGAEIQ